MSDNHQGEQSFTVTLAASQWNVVMAALWKVALPAELTNPVITTVQQQLTQKSREQASATAP